MAFISTSEIYFVQTNKVDKENICLTINVKVKYYEDIHNKLFFYYIVLYYKTIVLIFHYDKTLKLQILSILFQ